MQLGGVRALYYGMGVSIVGIIPYRGVYFGLFDTLTDFNPWQTDRRPVPRTASKFASKHLHQQIPTRVNESWVNPRTPNECEKFRC